MRPWPRFRLVLITCLTVAATATTLFVAGAVGFPGHWLWAPTIVFPLIAAVGWSSWGHRRRRLVAVVTVALSGMAMGRWDSQDALVSHGLLRAAMDSLPVPANFEPTGDDSGGWALFLGEATSCTRRWLAHGDAEEVRTQLGEVLENDGFVLRTSPSAGPGWESRRPNVTATASG